MLDNKYPFIRRWDGILKQATIWDGYHTDTELTITNANCFIYLSQPNTHSQQPSFVVPFEKLVLKKCQPLITRAVAQITQREERTATVKPPTTRQENAVKVTCQLYLEAPQHYNENEATQYNITTRNFFAWILGRPIVGPDPATALLALKIRMDLWRASDADNLAAVYHYARAQGYGELGDLQSLLLRRLQGIDTTPTAYTFLDIKHSEMSTGTPRKKRPSTTKQKFSRWMQQQTSREHPGFYNGKYNRSSTSSRIVSKSTDRPLLKGYASGAKAIAESPDELQAVSSLPLSPEVEPTSFSMDVERAFRPTDSLRSATTPSPEDLALNTPLQNLRSYSLPNMPHVSLQELWVHNFTREQQQQQPLTQIQSLLASPTAQATNKSPLHSTIKSRQGRLIVRSRAPSPIKEEGLDERTAKPSISLELQRWKAPQRPNSVTVTPQSPQALLNTTGLAKDSPACQACLKPKLPEQACGGANNQPGPGTGTRMVGTSRHSMPTVKDMENAKAQRARPVAPQLLQTSSVGQAGVAATRFPSLHRRNGLVKQAHRHSMPASTPSSSTNLPSSTLKRAACASSMSTPPSEPNLDYWVDRHRYLLRDRLTWAYDLSTAGGGRPLDVVHDDGRNNYRTEKDDTLMSGALAAPEVVMQERVNNVEGSRYPLDVPTNRDSPPEQSIRVNRVYRTPLQELPLEYSDTNIMDNILDDMTLGDFAHVSNSAELLPELSPTEIKSPISSISPISLSSTATLPSPFYELLPQRLEQSRPSINRLRTSLRSWTSRKPHKRASSNDSIQGEVLVLDDSGHFVSHRPSISGDSIRSSILVLDDSGHFAALPLKMESILDMHEVSNTNRSQTPMCELG